MRTPKTLKRFASYLRCSSDDQSFGDFTTIDTQRQLNAARIEQLGGTLIGEYNDEGKTGTNLKRPAFQRLLADAKAGKLDAVVVTYMSRLARGEVYHVAEYLLSEESVRVEMVQESFTADLAGQMNKSLKIFLDGMYPKQVSEWTKTKQAQMVAMGYHTGGNRPFGYAIEPVPGMMPTIMAGGKIKPAPKQKVPHPEEAHLVRKAFETFLSSRSIADVQRYLRSVDTTRNWPMSLVRGLLSNEVYRGVLRFGPNVNPSAHEALISEQLFDAVQELLGDRERQVSAYVLGKRKGREKDPVAYYLRGIVYCGCGSRMTPSQGTSSAGRIPYYECIQAQKNSRACAIKRVNAHTLHEVVLTELVRCAEHPSRLIRLYEQIAKNLPAPTEARAELEKLRRNRKLTEKKIGRIVEGIKAVGASAALTQELRSLEALQEEQQLAIVALEQSQTRRTISRPEAAQIADVWKGLLDLWEELTPEERSSLFRLVIDRVELKEKGKGTLWFCIGTAFQNAPPSSLLSQRATDKLTNRDSYSAGAGLEPATFGL